MPDSADIDAITEDIVESSAKPSSAVVDGNSVTSRTIDEKIKAANYVAGQVASGQGHFGLRFTQLVPPGCG
jgi:hypothetical protein